MTDIKERAHKIFDEFHDWYITNQIILHPDRDVVFRNTLWCLVDEIIGIAIAEERKKLLQDLKDSVKHIDAQAMRTFLYTEQIIQLIKSDER